MRLGVGECPPQVWGHIHYLCMYIYIYIYIYICMSLFVVYLHILIFKT